MAGREIFRGMRCSNCRLKAAVSGLRNQRRPFTNSKIFQKHGAVPKFTETSSPELQGLLSTFREKVLLPSHLGKRHRDLVFGARHKRVLEDDPVNVEIDGEEFRLKHIDRTKDQPNTRKALFETVSLLKNKQDWDNLPTLLEGLKTAGRKIKPMDFEKLVRKAGQAGRQDIILECARRVAKTGFAMNNVSLVREIMWWIQYKALSSDWNIHATKKALAMAEQTAIMLEDERHCGGTLHGSSDPRVRPEVIGVLLQLAAAEAKLSQGEDVKRQVEKYAGRLATVLSNGYDLRAGLPEGEGWPARSTYLSHVSPILHGIREAIHILDPKSGVVKRLTEQETVLRAQAAKERELLSHEMPEGSSPLGAWCYDKLIALAGP